MLFDVLEFLHKFSVGDSQIGKNFVNFGNYGLCGLGASKRHGEASDVVAAMEIRGDAGSWRR